MGGGATEEVKVGKIENVVGGAGRGGSLERS